MVQAGRRYEMTHTNNKQGTQKRFTATVTSVEDRGDFYYVGYKPDNIRVCRFGYCRVKKNGRYNAVNYDFKEV